MSTVTAIDVIGYIYCPPGWDEARLRTGQDAESITKIALETFTDIAYHKEKNAIQITGETQEDVYKAQTALNALFFPVIIKSKRQWARPDRPGQWGQRRDYSNSNSADANNANGNVRLRKMRSESYLQTRQQPQQNGWGGSPGWNSNANDSTTGHGWN